MRSYLTFTKYSLHQDPVACFCQFGNGGCKSSPLLQLEGKIMVWYNSYTQVVIHTEICEKCGRMWSKVNCVYRFSSFAGIAMSQKKRPGLLNIKVTRLFNCWASTLSTLSKVRVAGTFQIASFVFYTGPNCWVSCTHLQTLVRIFFRGGGAFAPP